MSYRMLCTMVAGLAVLLLAKTVERWVPSVYPLFFGFLCGSWGGLVCRAFGIGDRKTRKDGGA